MIGEGGVISRIEALQPAVKGASRDRKVRARPADRVVLYKMEHPLQTFNDLGLRFLAHRALEEGKDFACDGRMRGDGCGCDVTRSVTDELQYYTSKTQ